MFTYCASVTFSNSGSLIGTQYTAGCSE
ncbi:Protein of unknown function [Pyronema omphalodes CBS 100304]|uniref:Uncharacterized protein n=1 Tax=Pyronema omphalodes (strain CBS 100304) TaxID=1076935 RepID=U4L9L9_PYROM|nr:Protein of unknown function [Pyronema omphalodes CBS 100304]